MTESSTAEAKAALRAEIRMARGSRVTSDEESERLSQQLGQYCLDNRVSVAAAYLPMPHEPNIRGFLDWAKAQQIRVLLPALGRPMIPTSASSLSSSCSSHSSPSLPSVHFSGARLRLLR